MAQRLRFLASANSSKSAMMIWPPKTLSVHGSRRQRIPNGASMDARINNMERKENRQTISSTHPSELLLAFFFLSFPLVNIQVAGIETTNSPRKVDWPVYSGLSQLACVRAMDATLRPFCKRARRFHSFHPRGQSRGLIR